MGQICLFDGPTTPERSGGAVGGAAVPAMRSSGEGVPLMQGRVSLGMSICSAGLK